jgi:ABC transporter
MQKVEGSNPFSRFAGFGSTEPQIRSRATLLAFLGSPRSCTSSGRWSGPATAWSGSVGSKPRGLATASCRWCAREIGFVFQQFFLPEHATARENVADGLLYAGVAAAERYRRADEALERVGLSERARFKPTNLSGGERQRVAITRALVGRPATVPVWRSIGPPRWDSQPISSRPGRGACVQQTPPRTRASRHGAGRRGRRVDPSAAGARRAASVPHVAPLELGHAGHAGHASACADELQASACSASALPSISSTSG